MTTWNKKKKASEIEKKNNSFLKSEIYVFLAARRLVRVRKIFKNLKNH